MTTDELAQSYHQKCQHRLAALEVLWERRAFSDVVRESQEIVELACKGMLRWAGIDPPKWHDVGRLLVEHASRLSHIRREALQEIAAASQRLRKERELSFYGDLDFIPTNAYDEEDARWARAAAQLAGELLASCLARSQRRPQSHP